MNDAFSDGITQPLSAGEMGWNLGPRLRVCSALIMWLLTFRATESWAVHRPREQQKMDLRQLSSPGCTHNCEQQPASSSWVRGESQDGGDSTNPCYSPIRQQRFVMSLQSIHRCLLWVRRRDKQSLIGNKDCFYWSVPVFAPWVIKS